jgi:hypothetical protein
VQENSTRTGTFHGGIIATETPRHGELFADTFPHRAGCNQKSKPQRRRGTERVSKKLTERLDLPNQPPRAKSAKKVILLAGSQQKSAVC